MKGIFTAIIAVSLSATMSMNCSGQYKVNKTKYDYRTYKYKPGDPYVPSAMGFASAVMPGIGQLFEGEGLRGACFLGSSLALAITKLYVIRNNNYTYTFRDIVRQSNRIGQIGLRLWSGIDASRIAKVNNLAFRENYNPKAQISIIPFPSGTGFLLPAGKDPVGMTIMITF